MSYTSKGDKCVFIYCNASLHKFILQMQMSLYAYIVHPFIHSQSFSEWSFSTFPSKVRLFQWVVLPSIHSVTETRILRVILHNSCSSTFIYSQSFTRCCQIYQFLISTQSQPSSPGLQRNHLLVLPESVLSSSPCPQHPTCPWQSISIEHTSAFSLF